MSRRNLLLAALLCGLLSQAAHAAPILTVAPIGIVGGNREWAVNIAQDSPPGAMAAELAFAIDGADLLDVVVGDPAIWDTPNPGINPFTGVETEGIEIDLINDRSFSAYGSAVINNTTPTQFLKITTAGAGLTIVRYGTAASGSAVLGARIASNGQNFDGYTGAVTAIPEPATLALLGWTVLACVAPAVRRRRVA